MNLVCQIAYVPAGMAKLLHLGGDSDREEAHMPCVKPDSWVWDSLWLLRSPFVEMV